MKLQNPLVLAKAKTLEVRLVPTKAFFKPVVVIEAPCALEQAAQLGCNYLFDAHGNPQEFEGHHRLSGALAGARLVFAGLITGAVEIKTEKVAKFSCHLAEKKGMLLVCRAHLPEDAKLPELLDFLAKLNKDAFDVTIEPAQMGLPLVEVLADGDGPGGDESFHFPEADSAGLYPLSKAAKQPFVSKHVEVNIYTVHVADREVEGGELAADYVGGWNGNWKKKMAAGDLPSIQSTVFRTAKEASTAASRAAWEWAAGLVPKGPAEQKEIESLVDWLLEMAPPVAGGATTKGDALQ